MFACHRFQSLFTRQRSMSYCFLTNRTIEADVWGLGAVWWKGTAPPLVHHYRRSHNDIIYCTCKCICTENTARKIHLQNVGLRIWRTWSEIPWLYLEIIPLYADYWLVRCDAMYSVCRCTLLPAASIFRFLTDTKLGCL